jgi:hypothetical protein
MSSSAPYSRTPSAYIPTSIWETKFHTRIDQEAKLTSGVSLCGWKSCLFLLWQKSSGWGTSNTSGNSLQWCPSVAPFSAYYSSCVTPNVVFRRNPDRSYESQTLVDWTSRIAANRWCISIWGIRLKSTERAQCTLTWEYSRCSKLKNLLQ